MPRRKGDRARYTDAEKAAAIDAIVNGGASLQAAAELVGAHKSTVRDWLRAAGIGPGELDHRRGGDVVAPANAERLRRAARDRAELLDLLRADVSLRSARMLAAKLARAEADEELVELARGRWRDALLVEAQAEDFGPNAVREAKMATARARVDVLVAEATVPNANDLSMILNRSVRDLLAIEGYEHELADEDADGRITVVLTAPRPDRHPTTVVELHPEEARG